MQRVLQVRDLVYCDELMIRWNRLKKMAVIKLHGITLRYAVVAIEGAVIGPNGDVHVLSFMRVWCSGLRGHG